MTEIIEFLYKYSCNEIWKGEWSSYSSSFTLSACFSLSLDSSQSEFLLLLILGDWTRQIVDDIYQNLLLTMTQIGHMVGPSPWGIVHRFW